MRALERVLDFEKKGSGSKFKNERATFKNRALILNYSGEISYSAVVHKCVFPT